jgi:small-conductance mechanosensitive channel
LIKSTEELQLEEIQRKKAELKKMRKLSASSFERMSTTQCVSLLESLPTVLLFTLSGCVCVYMCVCVLGRLSVGLANTYGVWW